MIRKNRKKRLQQFLQSINEKIRAYTYTSNEDEETGAIYEREPIDNELIKENEDLEK
jgi:hypothetical protein